MLKAKNKSIIGQLFLGIVLVMFVSGLVRAITSFSEGICVSRFINNDATAALGIIRPNILLISGFGSILQVGAQVMCSRKLALGKKKEANFIYTYTILTALIIGLAFLIIEICISRYIAIFCGAQTEDVINYASEYLKGYFIGAPFYLIHYSLIPVAHLDGAKKTTFISIIAILLANVLGNIIAGYYFKTMFAMGLSTALGFVAGFLVILTHFISKKCTFCLSFKNFNLSLYRETLFTGLPSGLRIIFLFVRTFITNQIILFIGKEIAMTAYSIQGRVTPFAESIALGLISACLTLSSVFYGEEDEKALNETYYTLLKWICTVTLAIGLAYFFLAPLIASAYGVGSPQDEVTRQSILAMRADAIAAPFIAFSTSAISLIQGMKDKKYLAYILTFLQSFVFPVSFLLILSFSLKTNASIWFGISLGNILFPIIFVLVSWIINKKFPTNVRCLCYLSKNFGYKENQFVRLYVENIQDALNLSCKVLDFCKYHNIDKKRTNHLAACVEELAVMTVVSGFTRANKNEFNKKETILKKFSNYIKKRKKKTKYYCEIRIFYKNNKLTLRIRDNCDEFNITQKSEKFNQKDPTRNMAIRLIMGLANNIEYTNILKTNNLILSL